MTKVEKKIGLIGSAPSSIRLAPYNDPSWTLWGCSPGAYGVVQRVDAWMELHRWEPGKPWFTVEYINWMARLGKPVYMIEPVSEIPTSVAYPKNEIVSRFSPYFMTSSLSWMFALAIMSGATEIGLWGVDMSAQSEWEFERSGCHYFIDKARELGIKVTVPYESDLLSPPALYGFCEHNPMMIKITRREEELTARIAEAENNERHWHDVKVFLQGALDDQRYMKKTWVQDPHAQAKAYDLLPKPVMASSIESVAVAEPKPKKVKAIRRAKLNGHAETLRA